MCVHHAHDSRGDTCTIPDNIYYTTLQTGRGGPRNVRCVAVLSITKIGDRTGEAPDVGMNDGASSLVCSSRGVDPVQEANMRKQDPHPGWTGRGRELRRVSRDAHATRGAATDARPDGRVQCNAIREYRSIIFIFLIGHTSSIPMKRKVNNANSVLV